MKLWLDPLRQALDESPNPVAFFFRDDDAGWDDDRLFALLDVLAVHAMPIDLAAIPQAISAGLARELSQRIAAMPDRMRIHQHGFAHVNHERFERKCEFGEARDYAAQRYDIERGRLRLAEFFGPVVDPIFTPPWNRCTRVTGECLVNLRFRVLSRESNTPPLEVDGLQELSIHQDWFAHRKGVRFSLEGWGESLAAKVKTHALVGIMFHHAIMDSEELRATGALMELLANHPTVRCQTMLSLAEAPRPCAPMGSRGVDTPEGRSSSPGAMS